MREGVETILFVLCILLTPIMAYDLFLNNGQWWRIVLRYTMIDEYFASLVHFFT